MNDKFSNPLTFLRLVIPFRLAAAYFRRSDQSSGCYGFRLVRGAAPGYRDFGRVGAEGALGGVGNNGYSWASSVSGTNAMNLNFNNGNLNPSNAHNRGHGFQVRCLQAFITAPRSCF